MLQQRAHDRDGDGAGRRGQPRTRGPQPDQPRRHRSATSPTGSSQTAEFLLPLGSEFLVYAFQANLLEQVKRDVIAAADLAAGEIGGAVERTVCFADLVEFTSLGEEIAPEELGVVVGHFEELATEVIGPAGAVGEDDRRRGDVGLFRTPRRWSAQALDLVAAAAAEGDQFPVLRAGIATGPTLPQSGDYYGRSVNLASRITGIARPGSVLVDTPTREAAGEDDFEYSFAGERRLKGIDARTKLFRVRRAGRPARRAAGERRDELPDAATAGCAAGARGRGADGGDQLRSGGDRVPRPRRGCRGDRRLPRPHRAHWGSTASATGRLEPVDGSARRPS